MAVRGKSVYEPAAAEDGLRVLTTNYWPRGITRERAGTYLRILGPSRPLLRAFKDGQVRWDEYRTRYLSEMAQPAAREKIAELARLAAEQNVTVMCVCSDGRECHRSLLQELIEAEMPSTA